MRMMRMMRMKMKRIVKIAVIMKFLLNNLKIKSFQKMLFYFINNYCNFLEKKEKLERN